MSLGSALILRKTLRRNHRRIVDPTLLGWLSLAGSVTVEVEGSITDLN